jgi:hypothetical protein
LQQLTMLITAEGKWVLPDSEEFLAALGDPNPDYDAVGFAVRNLGFIRFQLLDRVVTEIELHPRNVDQRALLALEKLLAEAGTNLFRIKYLENDWHSEIYASIEHTIERLHELCAPVYAVPATGRFIAEPCDPPVAIFKDASNPMRPLAQKWRASFGYFDSNVLPLAISQDLLSRFAVVAVEPHGNEPIWRFIGDAHRWLGDDYSFRGIGEKVENIADKDYGQWAARCFGAVAASGQPRYDFVTAQIQYQSEPGRPRRPVYYERLLLPWKTGSGEVLVTSCAKIVSSDRSSLTEDNSVDRNSAKSSHASVPEV